MDILSNPLYICIIFRNGGYVALRLCGKILESIDIELSIEMSSAQVVGETSVGGPDDTTFSGAYTENYQ